MDYFVMNKAADFNGSFCKDMEYREGGLRICSADPGAPGIWISGRLDSQVEGTRWHRLRADCFVGGNMAAEFRFYGIDREEQADEIQAVIDEAVEEQNGETILERLERYKKLEVRNPEDILLHSVCARYLWIAAVFWGSGGESPVLRELTVYFPAESWTSYLPECYQGDENSFLNRYLNIFQTIYEELTQKIRQSAAQLDLSAASGEVVYWLAGWLNMDNRHLWTDGKLKQYLKEGAGAFRIRGTRAGLERMVEIYTGEIPYIVEDLDGEHPFRITLYVREAVAPGLKEYQALKRIIREGVPAHMEVDLVILRPCVFLNQDTYVGINSVLGQYKSAALDGTSRASLTVLGGKAL